MQFIGGNEEYAGNKQGNIYSIQGMIRPCIDEWNKK
jgi:hypothetical protein